MYLAFENSVEVIVSEEDTHISFFNYSVKLTKTMMS